MIRVMAEWWESGDRRWLRRHAIAAPFGIIVIIALLTYVAAPDQWNGREGLKSAASLVDLGAVLYAVAAVLVERGVRVMFWALDERRKWRERWRTEAQAEGLEQGLAQGRAQGRAQGQAEGLAQGRTELLTALLEAVRTEGNQELEELVERVARKQGTPVDE